MQVVGLTITDTLLTLSALIQDKKQKTGIASTCNYTEYQLENNAIYQLKIYNTTYIQDILTRFLTSNGLSKAPIVIVLDSDALLEQWGTAISPRRDYALQTEEIFGKLYYAGLRHEQLLGYKILEIKQFNITSITTLTIAYYYAYRVLIPHAQIPVMTSIQEVKKYLNSLYSMHGISLLDATSTGIYTIGTLA
jgi:hypothetical protein